MHTHANTAEGNKSEVDVLFEDISEVWNQIDQNDSEDAHLAAGLHPHYPCKHGCMHTAIKHAIKHTFENTIEHAIQYIIKYTIEHNYKAQ